MRSGQASDSRHAALEAIINGTPFLFTRCDRDLRIRFVSAAYARLTGFRPDELVGKSIAEALGRDALETLLPNIEKVLRGENVEFEAEIDYRAAGRRLVRVSYFPERDAEGGVVGWIGSIVDITGERRAEQARRLLASIVDSSDDAIVSKDLDGVILSWNPGAERIFGYSADDAVGRPITIVIPPELQNQEPVILERIRRGERIEHFETVRRRKDGERIHVSLTISPVRDATGRIVGASKIARDITARKRAEQALMKRAEEQTALHTFINRLYRAESMDDIYDAALDAISGALRCDRASILSLDTRGAMRFAAWRGLSQGYRDAVTGHSPWALDETNPEPVVLADVGRSHLPEALKARIAREGIGALVYVPLVAEGRLAGEFAAYYGAPHEFTRDEIELALNVARQLGFAIARRRAEEARQAAERDLRQLKDRLETEVEKRRLERDRIWVVSEDLLGVSDFDGYFLSINPAWTRLLGWSEDEIKAMHVSALRHPDDAPLSTAGRARLARGAPSVRMENRFRHKEGSWRWISWTLTAENGLIYVSGRHVTPEKEAAAALEQAQRQSAHAQKMEALGQLTGGVAHDFNNLLMVVSGQAQSLKKRLTEARDLRAVDAIQIAASRGERLTRQLLSFARNQPLSPTVVSPSETVSAIRDVLAGSLHVNIALAIDIPAETWPIRVDKSEVELALVNLAVNARDAMPEGGRFAISARNVRLQRGDTADGLAGEFVALSAADTGSGIPPDILSRVFEPFFTTKGADRGTGLGLSQVYGFARRSGGTVAVASEIGRGTTVTIYLPRSPEGTARAQADEGVEPMALAGETVLVVEDNREVRDIAVTLLEQLGYRTVAVDTAPAAFTAIEAGDAPSLVFTDVVLPGETDGLALARTLRARYPGLPVVLTTGYARAFEAEPEFPVLRKPYEIASLGRVLREALGGKAAGEGRQGA